MNPKIAHIFAQIAAFAASSKPSIIDTELASARDALTKEGEQQIDIAVESFNRAKIANEQYRNDFMTIIDAAAEAIVSELQRKISELSALSEAITNREKTEDPTETIAKFEAAANALVRTK